MDQAKKESFKHLVSLKTISSAEGKRLDDAEFKKLRTFLESRYSSLFHDPRVEVIWFENFTVLFHIRPKTSSDQKPVLILAHTDVVPADASQWDTEPFTPTEKSSFLYGRGTMDDKSSVFAHFEALDFILRHDKSFYPKRDIFFGFGSDEESGGIESGAGGANLIKDHILKTHDRLDFVWDEGGAVIRDMILPGPVAFIGLCEKTYLDVGVRIDSHGGHSSMSSLQENVILKVSKFLTKLESEIEYVTPNYFMQGLEKTLLEKLVAHSPYWKRIILSNLWLFGSLVKRDFMSKPETAAVLRTSMSFTILNSGFKENVNPQSAEANINFRVHPKDTPLKIMERLRVIADKMDFHVNLHNKTSLSNPYENIEGCHFDENHFGFKTLENYITMIYNTNKEDIVIMPNLCPGNTDSKGV